MLMSLRSLLNLFGVEGFDLLNGPSLVGLTRLHFTSDIIT